MLIPFTPIRTLAKILLLLMAPGGKTPVNVPVSITVPQQQQTITSRLMQLGPVVTKYEQGFLLQFYLSSAAYRITNEQMDVIMGGMNSDEKYMIWNGRADPSRALGAYIIQKGYLQQQSPGSSSSSYGHDVSPPPSSSLSNTGQGLAQHFEEDRRKWAPTLSEALQDNNISFGVRIVPGSRQANVRPLHGEPITMPPGTIEKYKAQGDITSLRAIRDQLRKEYKENHKKWFRPKNYSDLCDQLDLAENSLIDLGHYEYPQMQKVREMAKNGQMDQMRARRKEVETLLGDNRCFSGWRRNDEGGRKVLLLEKRCLDMAVNNELTKPFQALAVAEGPEVKAALLEIYRRYHHGYPDLHDSFVQNAAFNIIEAAHALARRQHPNGDQVIAETQEAYKRERDAELAPATQQAASSSAASMSQPTTTAAITTASTASSSTASHAQAPATSEVPATGTSTSSASSLMPDTTSIILDLEQGVAIDHMALDMVSTGQTRDQIPEVAVSPEVFDSILSDMNVDLMDIPVQDQIIHSLEIAQNVRELSAHLSTLSNQVFSRYNNLDLCDLAVEALVNESIQTIQTTDNLNTMISHVVMVNHVLSDLQDIVQQRPSLLARSPGIIARGVRTFALRCNPAGQLVATIEFWVDTLHFVADVTIGRLYLKPEDYQARIDNFSDGLSKLSPSKLAQLDADGWTQVLAIISADLCWGRIGLKGTIKYLQTLDKLGKTTQEALVFAEKLRQGVDVVLAKNPITIFKNKAVNRLANGIDEIKAPVKEVINSARALLESEYAKLLAVLEHEIAALKPIFDGTRKGWGAFSNKVIKINYEHILGMNPRFNGTGGVTGIGGFHHDMMNAIEKSGIFEFTNKVVHASGFYSARLLHNGNFIKDITFFPSTWSRKQVMNAIFEAYDNFKASGAKGVLKSDGKWLIEGVTKEGITIEMYVTQNALITTAYPILK
jgi:hypothetical protein